jgi:hypothetical protein
MHYSIFEILIQLFFASSVTSLGNISNIPAIRKNQGSISSNDSGHSEVGGGYCEGNVYHITSSIIHNAPAPQNIAAPLPPRRHSAVQGSNTSTLYQMIQPNSVNSSSTKQANGDISAMPPPPNPRTRPVPPFPISVPVLPSGGVPNVSSQYVYATQQYQQLRHTGERWF